MTLGELHTTGMFTETFGEKGDPLVVVHGLGGSTNTWYAQIPILARNMRITAYDLAGSGRTQAGADISIAGHVADLLDIVERAGAGGKVHLAGHSLGTIIAQHFAAQYPEHVASLALVGAFPEPPPAARNALRDRAAKARAEGMRGIADAVVTMGTSNDTKLNQPAVTAFVRESIMAQSPEGYARNCEALADAHSADLTRIGAPTLLLTGDEDKTGPPDVARALTSAIGGAEIQLLTGCGHWAPVERAKQVNYALTVFYARLRERATA